MSKRVEIDQDWVTRGKTIRQLLLELRAFENQDMEVKILISDGGKPYPISLVGKLDGCCVLMFEGKP